MSTVKLAKAALRTELKNRLLSMSPEVRIKQSEIVTNMVINSKEYQNSKRISIYLSLPEEVSTIKLLQNIFETGKQCFIPRYTKNCMEMVQLFSIEDYNQLPLTKWNIRQPKSNDPNREEALASGGLDLIIIPGLGFSRNEANNWSRLGRGKGYYDSYLEKCRNSNSCPSKIALAYKEQILDTIPTDEHDQTLDKVFHA